LGHIPPNTFGSWQTVPASVGVYSPEISAKYYYKLYPNQAFS